MIIACVCEAKESLFLGCKLVVQNTEFLFEPSSGVSELPLLNSY